MYLSAITCALVGALIIFFGIKHMGGDISSLHSYHRKNVKEEDVPAFGKRVGLGTVIMGASVVLMGIGDFVAALTTTELFTTVGMILMGVGLVIGCIITFSAMKKYNGSIF